MNRIFMLTNEHKPLCGWSGNPAGADTANSKWIKPSNQSPTFIKKTKQKVVFFFLFSFMKCQENKDPPENSSKIRKGSKYFSSNLKKKNQKPYSFLLKTNEYMWIKMNLKK